MNDWKRKFIIIWMGQLFSILTSTVAQFAIILWVSVEAGPAEVLSLPAVIGLTATGLVADRIGIPAMFLLGGVAASLVALVSFCMPSLRPWSVPEPLFVPVLSAGEQPFPGTLFSNGTGMPSGYMILGLNDDFHQDVA